jgi:hypothetical protein
MMPKMAYRFRVLFQSVLGILNETSYALSQNLVSVSNFKDPQVNSLTAFGLTASESVTFVFRDDANDTVYDGIQILKNAEELKVILEYLDDEGNVLRALEFEQPNIGGIRYDKLDYAATNVLLTINLTINYSGVTKL